MNKKLLIGIVVVLLLSVVGYSFAFFTANITGEGQENIVTAGTLRLVYKDGQEVKLSNAKPGDTITKTFTVSNTGTLDTTYDIIYKNLINEIEKDELVVSYTCISYSGYVDSENKGQVSGTCNNLSSQIVPYSIESTDNIITEDISIPSTITHEYTLIFTFTETNKEQNYNQNKKFSTLINITEPNILKAPRGTLKNVILADNPNIIDDNADLFASVADEESESGLFRTTLLDRNEDLNGDNLGEEVLYFRGVVENNYLVFAGHCWRIVRTNESGESIRLRYGGIPTISGGEYTCPQTGTNVSLTISGVNTFTFNDTINDIKYGGYVYDTSTSSNVKTVLESWYTSNIESLGEVVTNLIIDEPYCNDITYTTNFTFKYYGARTRLETNKNPQYKCPNASNNYTVNEIRGNGKLSRPIGLLSADEIAYAGGVVYSTNKKYYLYTNSFYWTMSPTYYYEPEVTSIVVTDNGDLNNRNANNQTIGLIPAISLSNEALVESNTDGSYNNPYIILN